MFDVLKATILTSFTTKPMFQSETSALLLNNSLKMTFILRGPILAKLL